MTIAMPSTTPLQVTFPGQLSAALYGATGEPGQGRFGVVGVNGGKGAAVSGVEGLQQVGGLAPAHFSHHDVIRAVTKRVTD